MFLGHTTPINLLKKINGLAVLDLSKQIQLWMHGPSINWKALSEINNDREKCGLSKLINIGNCNVHVVHGAVQWATESISWNFKNIMKGIYQVLKDTPACCEDYISITESTAFPLKFWVNFSDSRGIDQLALDSIMVFFPLSIFCTDWIFSLLSQLSCYITHWNWLNLSGSLSFKYLWEFPQLTHTLKYCNCVIPVIESKMIRELKWLTN